MPSPKNCTGGWSADRRRPLPIQARQP